MNLLPCYPFPHPPFHSLPFPSVALPPLPSSPHPSPSPPAALYLEEADVSSEKAFHRIAITGPTVFTSEQRQACALLKRALDLRDKHYYSKPAYYWGPYQPSQFPFISVSEALTARYPGDGFTYNPVLPTSTAFQPVVDASSSSPALGPAAAGGESGMARGVSAGSSGGGAALHISAGSPISMPAPAAALGADAARATSSSSSSFPVRGRSGSMPTSSPMLQAQGSSGGIHIGAPAKQHWGSHEGPVYLQEAYAGSASPAIAAAGLAHHSSPQYPSPASSVAAAAAVAAGGPSAAPITVDTVAANAAAESVHTSPIRGPAAGPAGSASQPAGGKGAALPGKAGGGVTPGSAAPSTAAGGMPVSPSGSASSSGTGAGQVLYDARTGKLIKGSKLVSLETGKEYGNLFYRRRPEPKFEPFKAPIAPTIVNLGHKVSGRGGEESCCFA